jgi:hypothetical protein
MRMLVEHAVVLFATFHSDEPALLVSRDLSTNLLVRVSTLIPSDYIGQPLRTSALNR